MLMCGGKGVGTEGEAENYRRMEGRKQLLESIIKFRKVST